MLKGYMVRERLGTPAQQHTVSYRIRTNCLTAIQGDGSIYKSLANLKNLVHEVRVIYMSTAKDKLCCRHLVDTCFISSAMV